MANNNKINWLLKYWYVWISVITIAVSLATGMVLNQYKISTNQIDICEVKEAVDVTKNNFEKKIYEQKALIQNNTIKIQKIELEAKTALVRINTTLENMSDDIEEIKEEIKK